MQLTGRRALLDAARVQAAARPGLLLHGPAGIGKSALVAALAAAPAAGTVLHCSPAEADARLPFAGLVDLFARVPESRLENLPPEPRAALRSALLRGGGPADGRGLLAVRVAVLDALRALAADGPVLLVVDGLQWLDEPTAEVLAHVVRRLADPGIRMLAAERVPDGGRPERLHCCPPGTVELPVPPLTDGETAHLVRTGLGADLPPALHRAVQRTAAGNPYYALELGRAARHAPAPAGFGALPPVPPGLRAHLLERARALPEQVRRTLLVASAAARPSLTLLRAAGFPDPAAGLAQAERLGIATADADGVVRFRHPVLRAAVHADAAEQERRQAHALLARAVPEPVERARHLALAHPYEDEDTARTLMAAAGSARHDGASGTAFELAALAARRTPSAHPAERAERLLAAAEYACDAGRTEEAGEAAGAVLARSGSAAQRVRARLVLLQCAGQALEGTEDLIADGLRDAAGDPHSEARLHHWAAVRGLLCGELTEAAEHARQAAATGDTGTRIDALATLARVRSLAGDPIAADTALTEALTLLSAPHRGAGNCATTHDEAAPEAHPDPAAPHMGTAPCPTCGCHRASATTHDEAAPEAHPSPAAPHRGTAPCPTCGCHRASATTHDEAAPEAHPSPAAPRRGAGNCATSHDGAAAEADPGPAAPHRGAGNCATGHDGAAPEVHPDPAAPHRGAGPCPACGCRRAGAAGRDEAAVGTRQIAAPPDVPAFPAERSRGPESRRLIRMRAILALDSDRVTEARDQVVPLLAAAGEPAGAEDTVATLVALTRIQVRAGHCREALRTAARCSRALTDAAPALYAAALAATAGGTPEEARRLAARAVRASEADGDRLFLLRALAVLGQAELLGGDPHGAAAAVEALQRVRELGEAMCAADPPLLHWYGDLAEALVVLGETEEAGAVLHDARARVPDGAPGSVLAALDRAEGLREAGLGRAREGAVRLRAAVDLLRPLPLPVELVRTLIALGAVERRARRRNAARQALAEALETATRIGAAPLAVRARDELARLAAGERGAEAGAAGPDLTPTEARIAELVGGGATNREVAAELFISVKTVEGTLSRVYRKVGVRSRTALAHAMAVAVIASGTAVDTAEDDQPGPAAQTVTVSQSARARLPRPLDTRR
ncbi:AAA family ATPase [Streptomyces sp. NPDC056683]|uniref:AAA family ATPase n=1 Tax=Streptomyces sp. NPDC056683 TaxID=3345910 RepID=UPI00368E0064